MTRDRGEAENTPIQFHIKIVKTDGLTKRPLAGAVFTITRKSGIPSHNGAGNGEVVATLTTNEKGEAISNLLTWGQYEVTEITVPEHYVDKGFTITVTGTENNKIYAIACENEPTKGWIKLLKTDSLDNHPIAGVQFDIYRNGEVISTMTTDADGVAVSKPLLKGKYTVKEHENPTGYTTELVSLDCNVYSDQTTNLTASNTPIQFRVKIEKTDLLTKEPLAGAEFTIIRKTGLPSHEGENDGEVVAVLVTDSNGEAVSDLLTWGVYEVKESKVPVHFVDNHFSITITGSEDNKTYAITCENEPTKGYIKIVKTDKLDRTPIEGVQFDIYANDAYGSGLAATMTTDKNGVAVSPALRKGTYIVKEHADPKCPLCDPGPLCDKAGGRLALSGRKQRFAEVPALYGRVRRSHAVRMAQLPSRRPDIWPCCWRSYPNSGLCSWKKREEVPQESGIRLGQMGYA